MADGEVKTQVSETSEATDKIAEILATFNKHIEQLAGHISELARAFENDPTAQSVHQPEAAPASLPEPTPASIPAAAAALIPEPDPAAELIYNRLIEIAPQVREMFPEDMAEQKKKLLATLKLTVDGLDKPDKLVPVVQALGARHRAMAQRTSTTPWLRRPCGGPCSKTLATPSRATWRAPGSPFTPCDGGHDERIRKGSCLLNTRFTNF